MARFSQQMLAGLLNPTYQKELTSAARGLGGAPGRMMEQRATERSQAEIQELLKQHANNPAKLQQLANEYHAQGNTDAATAFTTAATQATAKRTAQVSSLESGGQSIQKEAQRKRAVQVARQKGDQGALTALNARALDPVEYLNAQVGKKPEEKNLSLTTESVVETDSETGEVIVNQYRIGYNTVTGAEESRELIGRDKDQGKAPDDKRSLTEMLIAEGVPEEDIDLTTVDGLKLARNLVVDQVHNASLANTLTAMIEEKTPQGVGDAFDLLNKIDPGFAQTQTDLISVDKFKGLETLTTENISGLKPLIERIVSGTTDSDVRAVAELDQFRGNKDLLNKFNDFVLGVTSGRLSEDTVKEYGQIMQVVGALAERQQLNTINSLILHGDQRESEAAIKAKNFILNGRGQARIIPSS